MNDHEKIKLLERALTREKAARKKAEKILEHKSTELYQLTSRLKKSNTKLENLVSQQSSQLKGVFDNIVDSYVIMDLKGNVLKMNKSAINLLGYNYNKAPFNLNILPHPTECNRITIAFKSLIDNGILTNFQLKIITKSKQEKRIHINCSLIYNDKNNPIAAQGIARDITKDREYQDKLIASENRLSSLILNLDSGVLLENEYRKVVLTNTKFCELFNTSKPPEQLKNMDCVEAAKFNMHLFKNPKNFIARINQLVQEKKLCQGDELIMKNGTILSRNYIPIFKNNEYKGHLWTYKDITLTHLYHKSLKTQKEKYSRIIANMNLGIAELDNHDEIILVNQSFCDMSGYSEKELLGKSAMNMFTQNSTKNDILDEIEKRKKGQSNTYEIEIITKSGEPRQWLISATPNYNLNQEIIGTIGIILDITNLKNLQIQKEKLVQKLAKSNEELEEYAHIVSHDLKSPLRSIYALVSWLKEDNLNKLNQTSLKNFSLIEDTLEKMEHLISDILKYSSIHAKNDKSTLHLNTLIPNLIKTLYKPDHISITIKNKLPVINGDKTKTQQVFQNLISNAIKFIDKEKGLIEIAYTNLDTHHQFSVKDNGIGIAQQYQNSIFKLFHTLSKNKDSTGIGLSIVKKIVDLNEGKIWIESTLNKGSTFYFTLKK